METKQFKPLIDKYFWSVLILTAVVLVAMTVVAAFRPVMLLAVIPVDLFVLYFFISPIFGYVELRENSVFIKFGFLLKREIPYDKIRGVEKKRQFYAESIMSLKNALDHVNIKYNKFDIVSISVIDNDYLIKEIEKRIEK